MSDLQPAVPEQAYQFFYCRLFTAFRRISQQDQQIDIRIRKQLLPAIPAHCYQYRAFREIEHLPDRAEHVVCKTGIALQYRTYASAILKSLFDCLTFFAQMRTPPISLEATGTDGQGFSPVSHGQKPEVVASLQKP